MERPKQLSFTVVVDNGGNGEAEKLTPFCDTPCLDVNNLNFEELDGDGDGGISLEEFAVAFPKNYPMEKIQCKFNALDKDKNGRLDRSEFMRIRTIDFARAVILPKSKRQEDRRQTRKEYRAQYSCMPPPIFMFTITIIEVAVFIYHAKRLLKEKGYIGKYGPAPDDSRLIYDPTKREEVWRYLSYMLVHSGYMHLINNVAMQLVLGILLELVHKWWRVAIIYLAGVLAGSLATSVVNPDTYLAGASGGVYALIFAHMSTVILNWPEMEMPWLRVILFSVFASYDIGVALYYNYILEQETNVGYAAHIGGGVAGLLIGIYILKNFKQEDWEAIVWWVSVFILVALTIFAVSWNVFKQDYYPQIKT